MVYELGSTWRKWDLHIHTPESHATHYGANSWDRFIAELAGLPPELSVIGINDYLWVDGYEKVLAAQAEGLLPKIDAIFPVIELRLDDFIGTTAHLARLNAHAIFAPGTSPELIRVQFLGQLGASFRLTDSYEHLQKKWKAVPSRESLAELGALIKESVPEKERESFGPDHIEGFNNWVIPLNDILEAMDNSSFQEKPLVGLGKTEWADIPWGDNTIAAKRNLINQADLIFTAAENAAACIKSVAHHRESEVNFRLLDCSDAHDFSDTTGKDRLGNCFTWICADPTLAGLKHALLEYSARVFIGDKPPLLLRQETDPTNFVARLRVEPVDTSTTPSPSFDVDIRINPGFVAVIGNKGSGKSALLDSLALASNSQSEGDFTFLSERRYRDPRNNLASHYQVALTTADDQATKPLRLDMSSDSDAPERIRYLPQSLLEKLCNKEPGSPDDAFEAELRSIIFSHVPEHQRLGSRSLDELLRTRGDALDRDIDHRREQLSEVNREIAALEARSRRSRLTSLRASLKAINQQIASHDQAKPPTPEAPKKADTTPSVVGELEAARSQLDVLLQQKNAVTSAYTERRTQLDALNNLEREIQVLESSYEEFVKRAQPYANLCDLDLNEVVTLRTNSEPIAERKETTEAQLGEIEKALSPDGALAEKRSALEAKIEQLQAKLDEPQRKYEEQLAAVGAWSKARATLVGMDSEEGTLRFLESQIAEFDEFPTRLDSLRVRRIELAQHIHSLLLEKVEMYRELYQPVQDFLKTNQLARERFSLEFAANLEIKEFADRFLLSVDRGTSGSFLGVEQSKKRVEDRVKTIRPSEWAFVANFIEEHEKDLHFDRRGDAVPATIDSPADLLRKGVRIEELYDYLFGLSYLDTEYELKSDGQSLSQLSPGQKGTILLMFYLLVDKSGRPIALDQPDENLDNHTIHTLLRPAIRASKSHRQVFVVTHSPNLAVVGDADQVIVADKDGEGFSYTAGSIENPEIRDLVVKVLEGTWPAFNDRMKKYLTTEVSLFAVFRPQIASIAHASTGCRWIPPRFRRLRRQAALPGGAAPGKKCSATAQEAIPKQTPPEGLR